MLWAGNGVVRVLDLCCGTGLLEAELVPRGYRVTGVDASQPMLDVARLRLGPDADLHHSTLPEIGIDGAFDAAVSIQDGFTYLTPSDLGATLTAVADRLRPGGSLVFDLHTDAMLDFTAANPVVSGEGFAITSAVDERNRACDTTIEVAGPDPFAELHRQYFHADGDVRAALDRAGLVLDAVYDGHSGRPADESTLSATWVSRRA